MRVIIAGSRDHNNYEDLLTAIKESGFDIDMIVSGGARGVDHLGERYAEENGLPRTVFKANWQEYSRAAGPIRNKQMAEFADALIALWDGKSSGTRNMIKEAEKRDLYTYVYPIGAKELARAGREAA